MADPKELSPLEAVDGAWQRRMYAYTQARANARELEELRAEKQAKFSELTSRSFKQMADYVEKIVPEYAPENYAGQARAFASGTAAALRREAETLHGTALTWLTRASGDVAELVAAIASGEPVTEAHRDLARAIQERWESEAKGG